MMMTMEKPPRVFQIQKTCKGLIMENDITIGYCDAI